MTNYRIFGFYTVDYKTAREIVTFYPILNYYER